MGAGPDDIRRSGHGIRRAVQQMVTALGIDVEAVV
jgi:hypothetical protein